MRTDENNTDKMSLSGELDPIQYVHDNFDDYGDDGWGLNLLNLEEVTEEEMAKILPSLFREATDK